MFHLGKLAVSFRDLTSPGPPAAESWGFSGFFSQSGVHPRNINQPMFRLVSWLVDLLTWLVGWLTWMDLVCFGLSWCFRNFNDWKMRWKTHQHSSANWLTSQLEGFLALNPREEVDLLSREKTFIYYFPLNAGCYKGILIMVQFMIIPV